MLSWCWIFKSRLEHFTNNLVSAIMETNYVMERVFLNDLKHIYDMSLLTFLVTYPLIYMPISYSCSANINQYIDLAAPCETPHAVLLPLIALSSTNNFPHYVMKVGKYNQSKLHKENLYFLNSGETDPLNNGPGGQSKKNIWDNYYLWNSTAQWILGSSGMIPPHTLRSRSSCVCTPWQILWARKSNY